MIYTVTTTLPPIHGGRTKSLLSRVKLLDKELETPTTILTTNYNAEYPEVYKLFLEKEKVTKNIQYENIYDWLSGFKLLINPKSKFLKKETYRETPYEISELRSKITKNGKVVRYYDDENYVLYRKYYDNTKILEFEDFMSPISKTKIQRWQYNKHGILHRKHYYSHKTKQKILEEFFDIEGKIYCEKRYENNEINDLIYIQTYQNNRPHKTFPSEKQFFQYYFESRFTDNDTVFSDARALDAPLLNQSNKTNNLLVFHSSHLRDDNIKGSFKFALNNSNKVSKYIVLTHKQKNDIHNITSIDSEKFSVIPHFIQEQNIDKNIEKENRFIFLGRLGVEKQLDHIIKAYNKFLESGHTTKLAIFGRDELNQKEMIENLINDFGIQDKVSINDYTNNPSIEFQKSKASLLTSKFEGFALSVMESIDVGCPVISYDVRYGPSEIINHGENGYLVEANNISLLADYMKEVIERPLPSIKTKSELKYNSAIDNYKKLLSSLKD
ncbi:glycosyltransferase [Staphylococcus equorum]|uniref:glycosyltransferase n=1 Tax=Staphylococcus equorum TaxID=246432 RepID=UPI003D805D01